MDPYSLPGVQFSQPHHPYQLSDTEPVNTLPKHVASLTGEEPDLRFYLLTTSGFPETPRAASLAVWLEAVWAIKEAVSDTRATTHEVRLSKPPDLFIKISEASVFKLTARNPDLAYRMFSMI